MALLFSLCATAADDVFLYSSTSQIRGINLDLGTENLLTTTPASNSINALATNSDDGLVYYGDGSEVFYWDINLGSGAAAHFSLNDFASGTIQAPITNLQSGSGSYLNGVYYVGSEAAGGDVDDIYAITLSANGRTVVSVQALGLLSACNCTADEIGGFGDIAAVQEGTDTVLYAISASGSDNTKTGRWRFNLTTDTYTHLATGSNGQLSNSISGQLYTNVGQQIRTLDKTTGALGTTTLFTTAAEIYDLTSGFSLDFGDAPATYGAAMHRIPAQVSSTTFLGALPPDNEAGTLDSASGSVNGLGDDQSGTDDEDAVTSLNPLSTAESTYAFAVSCTAGAFVSAWIDFNLNGSFDAGERNNNAPLTCTGSSITLAWTGLSSSVAGASYARIRVADSATDIAQPTGISSTGEVEDYSLTILDPSTAGSCPSGQVATIFTASDVPKFISPSGTSSASSTLTVPATGNVLDLNVINVVGTHTYMSDLTFSLIRGGSSVALFGPSCGNNDDFDFGFDDESSNALVCPPVNGNNLNPTGSLSDFEGVPATGDWTLDIQDGANQDGGELQGWALEICTLAGPPETSDIRLGKVAVVEDNRVTFTFRALNTGTTSLSNISITDNLDDAFGAGAYTLIGAPQILSPASGFTANASYTGNGSGTELISNSGTLAAGEELLVRLSVQVDVLTNGTSVSAFTNQANTNAISSSSGFVEDLSAPSLDLTVDTDASTPISIRNGLSLSGRVFIDSSATSANVHDGVIQTGEAGVGNRLVSVYNESNGQLVDSTLTDGNGDWQFSLDGSLEGTPLQIQVQPSTDTPFISESATYSIGSVTDGLVRVIPSAASPQTGINVGVVSRPTLLLDNTQAVLPNTSVRHPHRYVASSAGTLALGLSTATNPASPAWPERLMLDQNCNGIIDTSDAGAPATINVTFDETVCLIVDVFVPANSPVGASHTATLTTTLTLDDPAATGHAVQFQNINTDTINVNSMGSGRLVLKKTVRNVTLGGVAGENNTGLPGHVLEYTINYENEGLGPISQLVINDAAPAFTQVQGASVLCGTTPVGMGCTPGVASALVQWDFTGALAAGASGNVSYRVTID
ncbi:MAG: GEVED domain-containing protein [Granulosicoccus sp.]